MVSSPEPQPASRTRCPRISPMRSSSEISRWSSSRGGSTSARCARATLTRPFVVNPDAVTASTLLRTPDGLTGNCRAERLYDIVLVAVGQCRTERQAEGPLRHVRGDREGIGPEAVAIPVIGLKMDRAIV